MNELSPIEPTARVALPNEESLTTQLSDLLQSFSSAAQSLNSTITNSVIARLTDHLRGKKLRYFAYQQKQAGSVANTVNLIARMIKLGFRNDVELIYNSQQNGLLQELAELLPGFDPATRAPYTLNGVTLTFFAYEETTVGSTTHRQVPDLSGQMPLCLCGGGDIPNISSASIALATKCDYFLLLQPYLWTAENCGKTDETCDAHSKIVLPGFKQEINLDDQLALQSSQFSYRAFTQELNPKLNWTDLAIVPKVDPQVLSAAHNISNALAQGAKRAFEFFPVYGLSTSPRDKRAIVGSADGIAFELIAAATLLQRQTGFTEKPVVIALLDEITSSLWQTLQSYFPKQTAAGTSSNGSEQIEDQLTQNINAYCQSQQLFQNSSGSGTGIYLNKDVSGSEGAAFLSKLQTGSTVVVTLPNLPPQVFAHLYQSATLPSVLEGLQNDNLAVNLGKPFFKLGSFSTNPYPSAYGNGTGKTSSSTTAVTARLFDISKNQIALGTSSFLRGYQRTMPPNQLTKTIAEITSEFRNGHGDYFEYYDGLKRFYTSPINDKLLQALGFISARFALISIENNIFADLPKFYAELEVNNKNGVLSLMPQVLKDGPFHTFLRTVLNTNSFTIGATKNNVKISRSPAQSAKIDQVIIDGTTTDFLGVPLDITLTVTNTSPAASQQKDSDYTVHLDLKLGKVSLPGVEWFSLEDTNLSAVFSSTGARLTGDLGTTLSLGDAPFSFHMDYPSSANGKMVVQGQFGDHSPSLNSVFTLIGGMNFINSFPPQVSSVQDLTIEALRFSYDFESKAIDSFQVSLKDSKKWPLLGDISLEDLSFDITGVEPTGSREISWVATTDVKVGSAPDPAQVNVSVSYPQTTVTATQDQNAPDLSVSDFVNSFLPSSYKLDVDADIANLSLELSPSKGQSSQTYAVKAGVNLDNWKITLAPAEFKLTNIYIEAQGAGTAAVGSISAATILFDGVSGVEPVPVKVTATFNSKTDLWTFVGEQGDVPINLKDIIVAYVGSNWWNKDLPNFDLSDLYVSFSTGSGASPKNETSKTGGAASSYEVGGTVTLSGEITKWFEFETAVTARFGNTGGSELWLSGSKAQIPILDENDEIFFLEPNKSLIAQETTSSGGKYGMISADVIWNNIELLLFFDYAPTYQSYGFKWGPLTAKIDSEKKTAILTFTDTTTLGSMVETFISWMTGSKFGLAAPWDLLNSVKLSGFDMLWDFGEDSVSFTVPIGPVDLGIASVKGVTLTYKSKGKGKGVHVELDGNFPWLDFAAESAKTPSWRADKPSTTPSPGGAGNKYLDLRLLAAGQHVAVKGLQEVTSVQDAIDKLADLKEPSPDKVPQIGFDGTNNWLFGTDFGVLRIDSGKKKGQEHQVEGTQNGPKYTFTMQVVFTDPTLYALRIACAGESAKIFDGLDFQIIYRKISQGLGEFSASIQLPLIMRRIDVGAVTITLPTFGIDIYTNGDFQIDVGFPWHNNFSHSFSVEAIIPPGIPVKGGGGFYFGKLPAAAVPALPKATNGFFNPNLVFGFGAQLGLGKSFEMGILKAGFSLTAFGILQGIIAKWNPYEATNTGGGDALSLQGQYFFSLTGTFGIIGKLYGSIDFAIVKASVNIRIEVSAQIELTSYEPIPLTISAKVDVNASAKINLGLFSIKISFSFSAHVHTTFTLGALQNPNDAPWVTDGNAKKGRLAAPAAERLGAYSRMPMLSYASEAVPLILDWSNLEAASDPSQNKLEVHLGYGLTLAKDENWNASAGARPQQFPCYVANMFITAPAPTKPDDTGLEEKAAGTSIDTPFEALAKMVARWVVAATLGNKVSYEEVNSHVISANDINLLLDELSAQEKSSAQLSPDQITTFLKQQFQLDVGLPSRSGEAQATYFPMPPMLNIAAAQGTQAADLSYNFVDYNRISDTYLSDLSNYFDELSVQVEKESKESQAELKAANPELSIASFIYQNYFLLLMKQMLQNMLSGLRDFNYPIVASETPLDVVKWVNSTVTLDPSEQVTLTDVFKANDRHPLISGVAVTIPFAPIVLAANDTLSGLASNNLYKATVSLQDLMEVNKNTAGLLLGGAIITYSPAGGSPVKHVVSGGQTLSVIASALKTTVERLATSSTIPSLTGLLVVGATLQMPAFMHGVSEGETLSSVAQTYEIELDDLAIDANGNVQGLFSASANKYLNLVYLPQFPVGELINEVQRTGGITHLSGMASRYYFHGMRLPTEGITPLADGMWVEKEPAGNLMLPENAGLFALSGQQIPIPTALDSDFSITLSKPQDTAWILFGHDQNKLVYTIESPTDDVPAGPEYQRIAALITYGEKGYLPAGPEQVCLLAKLEQQPTSFPIPNFIKWQSAESIYFPDKTEAPTQYLRLWPLPGALTALGGSYAPGSNILPPQLILEQVTMDEASGKAVKTPVTAYGWTSTVEFTIKKLPQQQATAPAGAIKTTYEISGVSAANILVLERLVQNLPPEHTFASVTLGYNTGSDSSGLQFVGQGGAEVTFGISQTNLSTITKPPTEMLFLDQTRQESTGPTLLNKPMDFVQLLWEAAITNAGGFYLYYTADEGATGLPAAIFNTKGEATLSLVIIHEDKDQVFPYVNGLATVQRMAGSGSVLTAVAKGELIEHTTSVGETLSGIAAQYTSNLNSLIANSVVIAENGTQASDLQLTAGVTINIAQGTYRVPKGTSAPGASFASIALRFGIEPEALKTQNPRIEGDVVPAGYPLVLPVILLVIGAKAASNAIKALRSLSDIAQYYGTEPIVLAAYNADVAGLVANGEKLKLRSGPLSLQPGEHSGVQALYALRSALPEVPMSGTDPDYAKDLLLNNFSLLAYSISDNQDFRASKMGLPIGASGKSTSPNDGKLRFVQDPEPDEAQIYQGAISYLSLTKPDQLTSGEEQNPYSANGMLLQTQLSWNDYYGNTTLTKLEDQSSPIEQANDKPALQGYTDQIIPLSQWPSTSSGWTVQSGSGLQGAGAVDAAFTNFSIVIEFSFDDEPFIPQQGQNPVIAQQRARSALVVVQDMLAQFNDPNGFTIEVRSTLVAQVRRLSETEFGQLVSWWGEISEFLIRQSEPTEARDYRDKGSIAAFTLYVTEELGKLSSDQVIELSTQLVFTRTNGIAVGDYAAVPSTRSVTNTIGVKTSTGSTSKPSGSNPNVLADFAQNIENAIVGPDYRMIVASGTNRYAPSVGTAPTATWGVHIGEKSGTAISFKINDKSNPEIYAPLPVSNTLISRTVPIQPYTVLDDFDPATCLFTKPAVPSTFSNVEMDVWLKQFFGFFDTLLSPQYSSSILFVDALATNKPQGITSYLEALTELKKSLADVTSKMLSPVYQGQASTRLTSVRETFKQTLLDELSNLYVTQAALSFGAQVWADIPTRDGEDVAQLYGNVTMHPVRSKTTQTTKDLSSLITLTSAKVTLDNGDDQPLNFLLQAPEKLGEDTDLVSLDLTYKVAAIEHQISAVPGIANYKASSWLSPIKTANSPYLEASLGQFCVPILLRKFPETPRMVQQNGVAAYPNAQQLSKITRWDYDYTYGLDFHYEQDKAFGEVHYNLKDTSKGELAGFADAFQPLAQFISVQHDLSKIIGQYVPVISAGNKGEVAITNASSVLSVFVKLTQDIATAASASNGVRVFASAMTKTGIEPYQFYVTEERQIITDDTPEDNHRWIVKLVSSSGVAPIGLSQNPRVEISGWTSHLSTKDSDLISKGIYVYYYTQKTGKNQIYLTQQVAQSLSNRQVVLPGMQVLARQDAMSSMYLVRNEDIGGQINEGFVFRTPTATFKNPYHPTLSSQKTLNIACLNNPTGEPFKHTLQEHLNHLFIALFEGEYTGDVTLQLNIGYDYHLCEGLTDASIDLPIALLPPTQITIEESGKPAGDIIASLAGSITKWASQHKPSRHKAELRFAMNIMSNLTENPMPLLSLENIILMIDDISPPLASLEGEPAIT
ncbi:LysM peptidoglycan-binding domain-containing protein [Pseudovibrio sp. Tun.PSC04-5.I4]|uniref:LysM peptidoglycan-binding domain-containing protein n=1 Tax=Pseudovibrio sp. Tun.PSC04-5.I4 TaxID=1798213 RepID=UPI00089151E7|nr:LysM peptidoglycan-binding domain-containing protein [Pseudovibrio sp. Tun.PSC04-5.I4]SDQ98193.1 hypothetical protein SAMN04515695_2165 [Pseudovibrio sp. Tun.PSC04-5.I4]